MVLPVSVDALRVWLHVVAAAVWVGGQLTLAGLVPALRGLDAHAPRIVARRFSRIAWPAFAVLVATGVWNVVALEPTWDSDYGRTVMVKIAVVAASGVTAALHARARTKVALASFGAASGLSALAAMFLGVLLG